MPDFIDELVDWQMRKAPRPVPQTCWYCYTRWSEEGIKVCPECGRRSITQ